jgi:hypothetical protein
MIHGDSGKRLNGLLTPIDNTPVFGLAKVLGDVLQGSIMFSSWS